MDPDFVGNVWKQYLDVAEAYNEPGRFTAMTGFEWTSTPKGDNLHRVVVYRDDASKAGINEPYTTLKPAGSDNPRDLWKWMGEYQDKTGGQLLAIAHNGNLSNGRFFSVETFDGRPLTRIDKCAADHADGGTPEGLGHVGHREAPVGGH